MLEDLDLIIRKGEVTEIRKAEIYDILKEKDTVVVSQTDPPLAKDMIGKRIEASFVVRLKEGAKRFFFPAIIDKIGIYPIRESILLDSIFLIPEEKKIYQTSLRKYERLSCKDLPVYVNIGEDRYKVEDMSEGGIRLSCSKDLLNPIRFKLQKELNLDILFKDDVVRGVKAEVVRRFDREGKLFVGLRFLDLTEFQKRRLKEMIKKIKGGER